MVFLCQTKLKLQSRASKVYSIYVMHAFGDPSDEFTNLPTLLGDDALEWTPETGSRFSTSDALARSQCAEFFLNSSSSTATNAALLRQAIRAMNSAV
jgi:hypothetical protein